MEIYLIKLCLTINNYNSLEKMISLKLNMSLSSMLQNTKITFNLLMPGGNKKVAHT